MGAASYNEFMSKPVKFKRRKTWNEFGHSHYLTFSTFHRKPYLQDDRICKLLAKRFNESAVEQNFAILAYVFMPDHVHILIHPMDEVYDMSAILHSLKKGPSKAARNRNWIDTVLWEPGGGYDSNITNVAARRDVIDYIHQNPVRKELVEESWKYRWSSANWHLTGEPCDVVCCNIEEVWG